MLRVSAAAAQNFKKDVPVVVAREPWKSFEARAKRFRARLEKRAEDTRSRRLKQIEEIAIEDSETVLDIAEELDAMAKELWEKHQNHSDAL